MRRTPLFAPVVAAALLLAAEARAQTVTIDASAAGRHQTIDGFGTCLAGTEGEEEWFQDLYFEDLRSSMLRFDLVPHFKAPVSDLSYNSPWFGQASPMDLPGPDGNNVRTYTGASDYTASFGGHQAAIAVMGPDIDINVALFDFENDGPRTVGLLAQIGEAKKNALGGFKLFGSLWSPAPWLKVSSGNSISGQADPLPQNGSPWPFVWGGNFSGGMLDTSGTPRAAFDDSALGGTGPTSALTQFARGLAAYLRGFQDTYRVAVYSISIQNELNFETFYNSCTYPLSDGYIKALVAARAKLDKYDDLAKIRIMGPEDLLGGDGYGMWQYGGGADTTHKNLQYLTNIAADPDAPSAIDFFCIHGYAPDGVSSAGATPEAWRWWADGWSEAPSAGLPASVDGFRSYGKKSWMTETSGESTEWRAPAGGFPGQGAWSIALKIHQALTAGEQSAWVYWQMSDGEAAGDQTLTDATQRDTSPKYVAAKHFFRFVRPGAVRVDATVDGEPLLAASAFVHDEDGTLVVELVNGSAEELSVALEVPDAPKGIESFDVVTSSEGDLWNASKTGVKSGRVDVVIPGYGIATLEGRGIPVGSGSGGGGGAGSGPGAGSGGGNDGGAGPSPSSSDGGCGCRVASPPSTGAPLALLVALAALIGRRRFGIALGGTALAAGAAGTYWFQPWKLFFDARVADAAPSAPTAAPRVLAKGSFRSLEHETNGTALVLGLPDGSRVLRLEDLVTSNGPELWVMLSATPATEDGWSAYDDGPHLLLEPLKGNLGSQNYRLPDTVDLARFKSAVVWCRRFSVGFGAAPI